VLYRFSLIAPGEMELAYAEGSDLFNIAVGSLKNI